MSAFSLNILEKIRKRTCAFSRRNGLGCDLCQAELFDYPEHRLCKECEETLQRNERLKCPKCGRQTVAEGVCLACKSRLPKFTRGFSPFVYRADAASTINRMKNGKPYLAAYFGERMAEYFALEFEEVEQFKSEPPLVIPVPISAERRKARGYNQAEELAECFCARMQALGYATELNTEILEKVKEAPEQKHMDYKARQENASGAYHVHMRKACKGRTILLIDDIMTTGATGNECAARLFGADAQKVYFVTATALPELK